MYTGVDAKRNLKRHVQKKHASAGGEWKEGKDAANGGDPTTEGSVNGEVNVDDNVAQAPPKVLNVDQAPLKVLNDFPAVDTLKPTRARRSAGKLPTNGQGDIGEVLINCKGDENGEVHVNDDDAECKVQRRHRDVDTDEDETLCEKSMDCTLAFDHNGECTVRVFRQKIPLEDAIGSHA
jgi:hypothetical protein